MSGTPDFFYREAQRLGYVARSAFKLLQMQKQYKIIAPGSSVLDLGCAPGAWLQVACQHLGSLAKGGVVVGIDIKKVKVPPMHCDSRVKTVCADVMNFPVDAIRMLSPKKGFSVVLSDMCPPVSGITIRDAALSADLGMRAINLAIGKAVLDSQGNSIPEEVQSVGCNSSLDTGGLLQRGGTLSSNFLKVKIHKNFIKCANPSSKKPHG